MRCGSPPRTHSCVGGGGIVRTWKVHGGRRKRPARSRAACLPACFISITRTCGRVNNDMWPLWALVPVAASQDTPVTVGLPTGSLLFPEDMLPHLKALQVVVVWGGRGGASSALGGGGGVLSMEVGIGVCETDVKQVGGWTAHA